MAEIGRMEKNKRAQIVVRTNAFKGIQLVDIREYMESESYTGFTKKGVSVRKELLDDLIGLLEQAREAPDAEEDENAD